MNNIQTGILQPVPKLARYLYFSMQQETDIRGVLQALAKAVDGEQVIAGLGLSVAQHLNVAVEGLRSFPSQVNMGIEIPATPTALCLWLRGDDRGELLHRTRYFNKLLEPAFVPNDIIDAFQYGASLDLSGYEDGTENPTDEDAVEAAIVRNSKPGLDGSSFMAIQHWNHDLDHFESLPTQQRDHIIGRQISDNEEIDDAPESAHVKRTAQEDFDPEAFVVRRSMPWSEGSDHGLVFVAFGHSFDAFEALLHRMIGGDDGIVDALFSFTHPVSGSYLWCPPMKSGHLDLSSLGL